MSRSLKKGPFIDHHLMVKVEKAIANKDKKLAELRAGEVELRKQKKALEEKQAELEKEVVYFKLQVERIMDEQFIDNMPPLVCDENVPCVEDELMEVERSEKNPKRKRKY